MAKDLYSNLDLNLLRIFLVLSQELNMRKASKRLFVSQPAISQSLQKLRHHFNDELFVKVSSGLEPTHFADSLAKRITPHLDGLYTELNHSEDFDPSQIEQKVKIALSPMVLSCLSGTLFHKLREYAPRAEIELISWNHSTLDEIQKGSILLGINYDLSATKELQLRHLIDLQGLVLVRKDHPIDKAYAEPSDFEGCEIASFINPGWNDNFSFAKQIMDSYGLSAKVGFRSEVAMALIDVVLHTDMILPHSNLFPLEHYPNLRAIDVNVEDKLKKMSVYSQFHLKNRHNPLVQWLSDEIQAILLRQAKHVDSMLAAAPSLK